MFITPHSNAFALLAKVDDEGKVEDLLEALEGGADMYGIEKRKRMYMDTDGYGAVRF